MIHKAREGVRSVLAYMSTAATESNTVMAKKDKYDTQDFA